MLIFFWKIYCNCENKIIIKSYSTIYWIKKKLNFYAYNYNWHRKYFKKLRVFENSFGIFWIALVFVNFIPFRHTIKLFNEDRSFNRKQKTILIVKFENVMKIWENEKKKLSFYNFEIMIFFLLLFLFLFPLQVCSVPIMINFPKKLISSRRKKNKKILRYM